MQEFHAYLFLLVFTCARVCRLPTPAAQYIDNENFTFYAYGSYVIRIHLLNVPVLNGTYNRDSSYRVFFIIPCHCRCKLSLLNDLIWLLPAMEIDIVRNARELAWRLLIRRIENRFPSRFS